MYVERPKGDTYINISPNTFICDFSLVIRCQQFSQGQDGVKNYCEWGDKILKEKKNKHYWNFLSLKSAFYEKLKNETSDLVSCTINFSIFT